MIVENKTVLVTGSADRVGKSIAMKLAHRGANIVIHYHTNKNKAIQTATEIQSLGVETALVQGDISLRDDWQRILSEIVKSLGGIDVLVNNAAIFYRTPFFETTLEQWDDLMNVNLKSVFLGCQIIGRWMNDNGFGKIINISDISSEIIWPDFLPYCISKAGIIALTKGLAKILAPNVLVNCIAPGTVLLADNYDENMENALVNRTPLKRIGSPEDVANTALFLIEGSDFITGEIIKVDGGRSLT